MATRWDKMRKDLVEIVNRDRIAPEDIPALDKFANEISFGCDRCKYLSRKEQRFLCDGKNVNCCREGYADYLNQEIEEE